MSVLKNPVFVGIFGKPLLLPTCEAERRSSPTLNPGSTRCNLSAKHNSWPRSTCLGFDDVRTCRGLLAKLFPVGCCNLGDFGSQNRFRIPEESTKFKTPNETLAENQKSSGDNPNKKRSIQYAEFTGTSPNLC